jgi:transcription elongation factor GreA
MRLNMTYVEEFRSRLAARDYNKVLVLWQEYCENDELDVNELVSILQGVKKSDMAHAFGQYVEAIVPLIMTVPDDKLRVEALRHVYDLETSNSQALYDLAHETLKSLFGKDPQFQQKLRLVGLRTRENFQGALSNFFLLNHISKGCFVFNDVGWGVGEVVDFSFLREQLTVEFENLGGSRRDISFKNAFRTLIPLHKDHFLVRRFEQPEELEKVATQEPMKVVHQILHDLGPKTAAEFKELLADIVIPATTYSKWWQSVRSKMKKDGHIEVPKSPKDTFVLRTATLSHDERMDEVLQGKETLQEVLGALYALIRDFPSMVRNPDTKAVLNERVRSLLSFPDARPVDMLQTYFLLEQINDTNDYGEAVRERILSMDNIRDILGDIEIVAMRKRFLQAIREMRADWEAIFLDLLFVAEPVQLKDYVLKELSGSSPSTKLVSRLNVLLEDAASYPEAFLWYFQKVMSGDASLMGSQADKERFFESFLILLSTLEKHRDYRDLTKKMLSLFTGQRFKLVRAFLKDTDIVYAKEFLLLASKCHSLSPHDQKILHSLFDVVYGASTASQEPLWDQSVVWTTEEGYRRAKERIQHIGTVEVVENAREIEAARAHGDLRENAEYKFALERRARLQNDLKRLSDEFNRARVITPDDIRTETVGIGSAISLKNKKGETTVFTILGQWDADPDKNILSIHSKLAQTLLGKREGDHVDVRGESMMISKIESYTQAS